ncbi:MAG: LptF/LptG family permease [Campylobacteraceae bacterium]|nr:LptF/LptG family permease [Campylobacteraceae bacterium]
MKLYSRYISFVYLKYFFILFIALECFYTGIDILLNLKDLSTSANLALLYVALTALSAVAYTLPLSLIFALILALFNMIRSNELISFYALGISKNKLVRMPFIISLLITCFYVYLNSTPFAYAAQYRDNLESLDAVGSVSRGIFLKYDDKYVYIRELNALAKAASGIKIIQTNGGMVEKITSAGKAAYDDNKWTFYNEHSTILPLNLELGGEGLKFQTSKEFVDLHGFRPDDIEKIYESSSVYSITDALSAIETFKNQGVNIDGIKATLYSLVVSPLFAPFMLLILFYHLPITGRFFNLALLSFGFFIVTISFWGVLFVMTRFSLTGVIAPEIGIVLPIGLLGAYAFYLVFKHR